MKAKCRLHQNPPDIPTIGQFVQKQSCLLVKPKSTLYDIVIAMRTNHTYAALVMQNSNLIGLLTERRTLLYLISSLSSANHSMERVTKAFNVLRAADVMIRYPETLDADMPVIQAFNIMTENGFQYMPVLKGKLPAGILSLSDITRHLQEENRRELESKDMMLSYLMHHENYGCV